MDERTLMAKIAGGDEAALHALLRQYGPLIRYILRPILTDERDREECYADISLKIWQTAGSFDGDKGALKSWLTVLSRNAALNHARRSAKHENNEELSEQLPSPAPTPEEDMLRQEREKELYRSIQALSTKERALFYRKYYYLQSTAQIASELGMTQRAVEGKLYRIRRRLREQLGGDERG